VEECNVLLLCGRLVGGTNLEGENVEDGYSHQCGLVDPGYARGHSYVTPGHTW
jgi:hypothetical protein